MKLFVANRGEIAVRVLQTARRLGVPTAVGYADADVDARFTREADAAVRLGPSPPAESYLDIGAVLAAARATGCDTVHPGYGFLSENAAFAQAVLDAGLCWVGPSPAAIAAMGDKRGARERMRAAGVPVVPGVESTRVDDLLAVGFPLLLKAAMGGGGRGMRAVAGPDELAGALADAASEALRAFGDGTVYAERRILRPRHVEVQILGDTAGNVIHLHERECSIQRRHQKVIEEAPCVVLTPALREALCAAAVRAARAVDYVGAGTVEFLLADDGSFYFLEMNTRIQVEHPVTEAITGLDLVAEQLRIAAGEPLGFDGVEARGHAIEARIYAEDPANGWIGAPGTLRRYREPRGPGVRVDSGVYEGCVLPVHYDPMIAKVITHGKDREEARQRLVLALSELEITGVPTTSEILRDVSRHPAFISCNLDTSFLDDHFSTWAPPDIDDLALAAWALGREVRAEALAPTVAPTPWERLGRWP